MSQVIEKHLNKTGITSAMAAHQHSLSTVNQHFGGWFQEGWYCEVNKIITTMTILFIYF